MAKVTTGDFREIKAMLRADWDEDTIVRRSGWSAHTIARIKACKTFVDYRRRVYDETQTIRQRRERHSSKPALIDETMTGEEFQAGAKDTRPSSKVKKGIRRFLPW